MGSCPMGELPPVVLCLSPFRFCQLLDRCDGHVDVQGGVGEV